jgi:hypothetical protein
LVSNFGGALISHSTDRWQSQHHIHSANTERILAYGLDIEHSMHNEWLCFLCCSITSPILLYPFSFLSPLSSSHLLSPFGSSISLALFFFFRCALRIFVVGERCHGHSHDFSTPLRVFFPSSLVLFYIHILFHCMFLWYGSTRASLSLVLVFRVSRCFVFVEYTRNTYITSIIVKYVSKAFHIRYDRFSCKYQLWYSAWWLC